MPFDMDSIDRFLHADSETRNVYSSLLNRMHTESSSDSVNMFNIIIPNHEWWTWPWQNV